MARSTRTQRHVESYDMTLVHVLTCEAKRGNWQSIIGEANTSSHVLVSTLSIEIKLSQASYL